MKILAVGDIYGEAGLDFAVRCLRTVRESAQADVVIVNAENCAPGNGTDRRSAEALLEAGADVLTGGNHSLRCSNFFPLLEENDCILRPLNFPELAPGKGHCIYYGPQGVRMLVLNAQGQVFMDYSIDNPFTAVERTLNRMKGEYDFAVCDFHAEATSEKAAFLASFDGRISAIWGTHTHVQTADERVTKNGTGFLSDLGMTGVTDSVIGADKEAVVRFYHQHTREKYVNANGECILHGAVFDIDSNTGKCREVKRIQFGKDKVL